MSKRSFGAITRLPSKRYRARYTGPDTQWHNAPTTFTAKIDAEAWLAAERRLIDVSSWTPPAQRKAQAERAEHERRANTFSRYADTWLEGHVHLAASTQSSYRTSVQRHLKPAFGELPLTEITPARVRSWHTSYGTKTPTARAHAYQVLSGILQQAEDDEILPRNPCRIRGATSPKSTREPQVLSLPELLALAQAMPVQHRALTLLSGLCGLRFGEATALRRQDIDLERGLLHVRRGAIRLSGHKVLTAPKTPAAVRSVAMPASVVVELRAHIKTLPPGGRTGLVFPGADGEPLANTSVYGRKARTEKRRDGRQYVKTAYGFYAAREVIGRPTLHWHDLRRTAATLGAQSGATVREMQHRLGHTTPAMALHYQAATLDRDRAVADRLEAALEVARSALEPS